LQASKIPLLSIDLVLERAGAWLLDSGIQDASGGVARYYLSDSRRNAPVSTEITGYAASALVYLWKVTGNGRYLDAAKQAACYLIHDAWSESSATFPFEPVHNGGPSYAYFFDCGIITRGLLAVWRTGGDDACFERAKECGLSMAFDFMAGKAMHPILRLPDKQPLAYERRWSRAPGCYQLKSAMAWSELASATGHRELGSAFERMLAYSLNTHNDFLPGDPDDLRVMDRLHAYSYFLEGLLAAPAHPGVPAALGMGLRRAGALLRRIEPEFARSDVYAQLLRVRLFAEALDLCPLDRGAAEYEAARISEFQVSGPDRATTGGFYFGTKRNAPMPFVNPVSTAFAIQALALWQEHENGGLVTPPLALI
jgi:hypothetical protein